MTTKYFNVKQGITTGNILLDGITGNITAANANIAGNIIAGNITTAGSGGNITGANVISANTFIATITANVGNLNVTGLSNLGNVGNVTITGGTSGQFLTTNGAGGLSFASLSATSIANGTSNVNIPTANGNVNLTAGGNTSLVVTSTGANIAGTLDVTGNLTAGNIIAGGGSGGNIAGANVITGNTIIATVTANVGNLNVSGLSNLGNVGNVTITGGTNGYYLQTNGSGSLVWAPVASGTGIANGNSNVNIPSANGNINFSAVGNTTMVITGTGANIAGTLDVTGNLTAGNITGVNVVSANTFISTVTTGTAPFTVTSTTQVANLNVATAGTASTVTANAQPNITSVGTLSSLSVTGTGSFGANVSMNSFNIVSLAVPINDSDAATKGYVDAVAQGIDTKEAVVYATASSIFGSGYTYNNGTSGVGATLTATTNGALSIDGSTPTAGDRVLIKNEVGAYVDTTTQSAAFNGIYVVTQVGSVSLPYILTRSVDFDTGSEIPGAFTFVTQGTANQDTGWICTTNAPVIVGTSQILWSQFSSAGSYTAGTGLTLVGNQFNISNTAITPGTFGNGDAVATFTVNQQGQLTAASNTAITANAANLTGTVLNSGIITSSLTSVGTLTTLAVTGTSNLGNVGNVTITGGTNGYYLQTNGSGNLVWAAVPSGTGIANGTSNVDIPTANGNINLTAGGNTSLVVTATGGNISGTLDVTGNLTAGNITTAGSGGNITGANVILANTFVSNVTTGTAPFTVTSTTQVANLNVATAGTAGTVTTAAQPNITSVGTLTSLDVTGNLTAGNIVTSGSSGNITGANVITGNTIIATVTANVGNLNVSGLSNLGPIGNVTITGGSNGYVLQTNGSGVLTWVAVAGGTGIANGTSNVAIPTANGNINVTAGGNTSLVVTDTGANISGTANISGNLTVGANITGANVISANTFIASGNITANYVAFNGGLTSNRSNVSVTTNTVIDQFDPGTFRTAKYIISASGDDGFQSVETLLVHDGSTSYITIYGSICSNNSADIIDLSSNVNSISGNVAVYATGTSANLKVNMVSTYIKT